MLSARTIASPILDVTWDISTAEVPLNELEKDQHLTVKFAPQITTSMEVFVLSGRRNIFNALRAVKIVMHRPQCLRTKRPDTEIEKHAYKLELQSERAGLARQVHPICEGLTIANRNDRLPRFKVLLMPKETNTLRM